MSTPHVAHRDHGAARHRARATCVGVACLLAGVLAACSSSSGGTAKATGTTTTRPPAGTIQDATSAPPGKAATSKPVPSAGCGTSKVGVVTLQKELVGTPGRFYLLTTPKEHDGTTPLPLVLDFHGLLEGAVLHATNSQLAPFAQKHGFVVAMPNGSGAPVHWAVANDVKANPDLVFVTQVLDQIEARECIDTSRVYATGLSNGAFLSSTIACTMADRFTAIAPVSGLTFTKAGESARPVIACNPSRHVPVLTFHGTADPILLFNGGVGDRLGALLSGSKAPPKPIPPAVLDGPGYPAAVRAWAHANGCRDTFTDVQLTASVTQRSYRCPADGAVVFDIIKGGGHTWPGTQFSNNPGLEKLMGHTDESIDANTLIWDFFRRFALPTR